MIPPLSQDKRIVQELDLSCLHKLLCCFKHIHTCHSSPHSSCYPLNTHKSTHTMSLVLPKQDELSITVLDKPSSPQHLDLTGAYPFKLSFVCTDGMCFGAGEDMHACLALCLCYLDLHPQDVAVSQGWTWLQSRGWGSTPFCEPCFHIFVAMVWMPCYECLHKSEFMALQYFALV